MSRLALAMTCALTALVLQPAKGHTPAADGCGGEASAQYSRELQIMRAAAVSLAVPPGSTVPSRLELGRRYAINLAEQGKVSFRTAPARAARGANPRAGVFRFVTGLPGKYRVTLTSRHWVDVIDGAAVVASAGHFGPGCALAHKIVEFELPGEREMTLQVSGREDAIVGLAITYVAEAAAPVLASNAVGGARAGAGG